MNNYAIVKWFHRLCQGRFLNTTDPKFQN